MPQAFVLAILRSPPPLSFPYPFPWGEAQVSTVAYRRLAALVSPYQGPPFIALSREEKLRALLAHQAVIERVMDYPLLPMKFPTLLGDIRQVHRLLGQGYPCLRRALAEMEGVVEMEVAATWDIKQVLGRLSLYPEVMELKQGIAASPHPSLEQRVELGKKVKELLDGQRQEYQKWVLSFLKGSALDFQPHPLLAEELVLNLACLVPRAGVKAFEARLQQLSELIPDRLNFRLIGPLPPYSFSLVEVGWGEGEKMEQARQLLGLGTVVSLRQIKQAYRHRAAQLHPDAGLETDPQPFQCLQEAYERLVEYARHQGEGEEESFSLDPQAVEGRFLISVTRSSPPCNGEG